MNDNIRHIMVFLPSLPILKTQLLSLAGDLNILSFEDTFLKKVNEDTFELFNGNIRPIDYKSKDK